MTPLGGHRIDDISFAAERIVCTCEAIIQALPDHNYHEAHQPLVDAWQAHRRDKGLITPPLSSSRWHRQKWSA